jgi:release factor glutamine methyltransferase
VPRERLIARPDLPVADDIATRFAEQAMRRRHGEPLAYLLGRREFYGHVFEVNSAVLVPRPETEVLVERAVLHAARIRNPRVLDLGTGSGCIAISLALAYGDVQATAVDCSADALAVAERNAERLGAQVRFVQGDWFGALPASARFDLIVSNPPYVAEGDPHLDALRFEPQHALTSGADGLQAIRHLVAVAPRHLTEGGWLLIEHGFDQADAVRRLMVEAGLDDVGSVPDLAGIARLTEGRRGASLP